MEKKYKCGLYIGRFQPIHVGHTHIIAKMLLECEKVIIAIGSSQEGRTKRNPFHYGERRAFIEQCFPYNLNQIYIIPVPDRKEISNDASWGDYVFDRIKKFEYDSPDVVYEGEESERATWYDNLDVEIVKVPRTIIPISATEVRAGIIAENEEVLTRYIPYGIRHNIDFMKEVIKNANKN